MSVSRTKKVPWLFVACFALFSIVNVLSCAIEERGLREISFFACLGAIGAEACLHSVWCVLSPIRWALRMATGGTVAFGLICAWAIGYIVVEEVHVWGVSGLTTWEVTQAVSDLTTAFCWLPLLLLSVQMPLWAAKYWLRWRILQQEDDPQNQVSKSFGIRQLMIGTAAIAICLALGKYGDQVGAGEFIALVITALVVVLISASTTIPATVATLRSGRPIVAMPLIFITNAGVLAGIVAVVISVTGKRSRWPPPEFVPLFVALVISFTLCLTAPLLIARRLGYRLHWGRE